MFHITGGKGFHIEFPNGWAVSVQWGPGNYGDNWGMAFGSVPEGISSATAEVGIWKRTMRNGDRMKVVGYQTPSEVAAIIAEVAAR